MFNNTGAIEIEANVTVEDSVITLEIGTIKIDLDSWQVEPELVRFLRCDKSGCNCKAIGTHFLLQQLFAGQLDAAIIDEGRSHTDILLEILEQAEEKAAFRSPFSSMFAGADLDDLFASFKMFETFNLVDRLDTLERIAQIASKIFTGTAGESFETGFAIKNGVIQFEAIRIEEDGFRSSLDFTVNKTSDGIEYTGTTRSKEGRGSCSIIQAGSTIDIQADAEYLGAKFTFAYKTPEPEAPVAESESATATAEAGAAAA